MFRATACLGVVLSLLAAACQGGNGPTDDIDRDVTPPTVHATIPEHGATDVARDVTVVVDFSEPMDPQTITEETFQLVDSDGQVVSGTIQYDIPGSFSSLTPDDLLERGETYTALVSSLASDVAGNRMVADHTWTFQAQTPQFLPPPVEIGVLSTFVTVAGGSMSIAATTYLNGDVAMSPGTSCSGCAEPDVYVSGTLYVNDAEGIAASAQAALSVAFAQALAYPPGTTAPFLISADLDGQVLGPGVYTSASTMTLAADGTLTLDAGGDPDAFWVFQVGSNLTANADSRVLLVNSARVANVFWAVGSSSSIRANAAFQGTVMAQASNTAGTGASVTGRLLSLDGAISLMSNQITLPSP